MPASERGRISTLLHRLMRAVCRLGLRIEVDGLTHLDVTGAAIVVFNHLSLADGPMVASLLQRNAVFLVAREFDWIPILGWWIRKVANPIYVNRGAPDRRAVRRAVAVLERGGLLCLAPEGGVSRTGALTEAHHGAAFIGRLASAPVVPVAAYGQEKFWRRWLRLRRPHVHIVVGEPIVLPHDQSRDNTTVLMRRIAELLPPAYRGVYATGSAGPLRRSNHVDAAGKA
jgi:1-acyl-sn-glycerol-3-phosphate acyltransferase